MLPMGPAVSDAVDSGDINFATWGKAQCRVRWSGAFVPEYASTRANALGSVVRTICLDTHLLALLLDQQADPD